jgi:hypothetical protein
MDTPDWLLGATVAAPPLSLVAFVEPIDQSIGDQSNATSPMAHAAVAGLAEFIGPLSGRATIGAGQTKPPEAYRQSSRASVNGREIGRELERLTRLPVIYD